MRWTILILFALFGCASAPEHEYARYADCVMPITRDAGMGVRVDGCAAWQFGPSKRQQINFRNHGL
jgi:hypothetical protein